MTAKEIREKRKQLAGEINRIAELIMAEGRGATDEEQKSWDQHNADIDGLGEQLKFADRAESLNAEMSAPVEPTNPARRLVGRDHLNGESQARESAGDGAIEAEEARSLCLQAWMRCNSSEPLELDERHEQACKQLRFNPHSKVYRIAMRPADKFAKMQRNGWGGGYGRSHVGAEERALSTVIGATGGFTVPETLLNRIEVNMLAFGGVMQAAEIMRTASGEPMNWPTFDDTTNTGVQLGESVAVSEADPTFGSVNWSAYKFSSKEIKVPSELLEDSAINVVGLLGDALGERLGRILNTKFTTGTGAGTPKGIVTASTAGKTTAGATAILWGEITDLVHSIDPAYRPMSAFMFHDGIMQYLRKIVNTDLQPLWLDGPNSAPPATLMGYPYFINQDMQATVATGTKTMLFGRLSQYKVRMVGDIRMYRLVERHRENDQDAFLAFVRGDGNLLNAGTVPVKHLLQA